jgi:endonuclease YncB( thermonuclease family)
MSRHRSAAAVLALLLATAAAGCPQAPEEAGAARLAEAAALVEMEGARIRPDDGDSFFYGELTIRVVGLDAPEIRHEAHGILEDQELGPEAATFTEALLRGARRVQYLPVGEDRYGRTLAHVVVDGELLAERVIRAGLAWETVSAFGDGGQPGYAARILHAAREAGEPPFEEPYRWRRKHQRKGPR